MFCFPDTWFNFNLHRRNIIFSYQTKHTYIRLFKFTWAVQIGKNPLPGMVALYTWLQIPIPADPLLRVNFPIPEPPHTAPSRISLLPTNTVLLCTQMTFTRPNNLLSGTVLVLPVVVSSIFVFPSHKKQCIYVK
jgi:hypothetical protein